MKGDKQNLLIIAGLVVIAVVVYYYWVYLPSHKKSEGYVAAGGLDHVGSLDNSQYDSIPAPDYEVPAAHFADLVEESETNGGYSEQPDCPGENLRPYERLHRVQGEALMPRTSLSVTPYNIDVANPASHQYMVNAPRVSTALKSRYKDYGLASMIRGDIPITHHPNVCLINKTHLGRDDLRLDGLFSDQFKQLYRTYTGDGHKNLPIHVAGAGVAACGDGAGAQGGTIMDSY